MRCFPGRVLSILVSCMLLVPSLSWAQAPQELSIVVTAGQGAIHNVVRQVVVEPVVEIRDEQGRPVAGATVTFACPATGASASFVDGTHTLSVTTNQAGQARALGMQPNTVEGSYTIYVTATQEGLRATAEIYQTNAIPAQPQGRKKPFAWKILAAVIAGAATGAVVAVRSSDKDGPATPTTITLGGVQVGAPR